MANSETEITNRRREKCFVVFPLPDRLTSSGWYHLRATVVPFVTQPAVPDGADTAARETDLEKAKHAATTYHRIAGGKPLPLRANDQPTTAGVD
jgi:predicted FMN-binding regulatory protein PaiB